MFAVTVFVEADDAVHAIDVAGDLWLDPDQVQQSAALGDNTVEVRPARAGEGPQG